MGKQLFDLSGKAAVITGGNGGIGLGFAKGIANQGGDVCVWGSNPEKNKNALTELQELGTTAHAITVDVSNEDAVNDAFAESLDVLGRVDACFANAGVGSGRKKFDELDEDEWRRVLSVNLDGFMYSLRAAARHMKERAEAGDPGGRLVGTSSISAILGYPTGATYAGSKGAVIAIMQSLAVELARYKVTANSILPGMIETPMTEKALQNEEFSNAFISRIPARRAGTPEDFEAIAVYLMSDASQYHTGDKFTIDGGFMMY
jgi:NAD(P)-dependent dehydrogenase (short-subunit alcohol dehydrogenase family)